MPSSEEINAIFDRILAGQATDADIHALRLELQQGKYRIEAEQLNANEIHIGDRIYHGADAEAIRAVLGSVLDEQQKLLEQQRAKRPRLERDFLGMVKAEVADRLKQSLHHAVLINLGKEEQPEQVEQLWDAEIKVADHPNAVLPSDTKIIDVFNREDIAGRLLILGNPGSGKTTTLLELAKALIEQAEIDSDFPVPVLFNLPSWKDNNQPLHEWMVQELKLRGVRSDITRKWLDKRKLLPMLDGLDEMKPDRQETCVEAINKQLLTGEKSLPYLVVCSRNEEYDNYETKLLLNGAIYIQELTIDKIQNYLNSVDQFELCHALDRDTDLLNLVCTPLFLSIASLAFQELSHERWQTLVTTEARIEHLLDAYVRKMLERPIFNNPYSKKQLPRDQKTRKWLIWLAQQMKRESQSEFLIEKIQPSFLQTSSKLQGYKLGTGLASGLIFGLIELIISIFSSGFDPKDKLSTEIFYTLMIQIPFILTNGLACSLSSVIRPFEHSLIKARHRILSGLIFGILFSFYSCLLLSFLSINKSFLITASAENSVLGFADILFGSSFIGLFAGIIGASLGGIRKEILIVESLQWSWRKAKNKFISGIKCTSKIALVIASLIAIPTFIEGLWSTHFVLDMAFLLIRASLKEDALKIDPITVDLDPMAMLTDYVWTNLSVLVRIELSIFMGIFSLGLIIVLTISITGGLTAREVIVKDAPNQGIKRSVINAIVYGLSGGLIYLVTLESIYLLLGFLSGKLSEMLNIVKATNIAFAGLSLGIPIFFRSNGGAACLQHFVLRFILYYSDYAPWNYARFLNYCTERSLLQRVGGRYQFIHRLLQEHFAAMPFKGIEADQQRPIP